MSSITLRKVGRMGLACLLLLTSSPYAWGEGLRNSPPGATGLARGGGKLAHIDDATSLFINPANATRIEDPVVQLTPSLVYIDRTFRGANGLHADTKDPWKVLGGAFAVYPTSDSVAFGVSLYVPYGQSIVFPQDSDLRFLSPWFSELKVVDLAPTISAQLNDQISIGGGIDLMWSELELRQFFPWSAVTQNPATPDGEAKFKGDGYAVGANVGITYTLTERQTLSAIVRSPFEIDYDGDFNINNVPAEGAAIGATPRSDFDSSIKYPTIIGLGYGLEVLERSRVGLDVEWVEWSRVESLDLQIANNSVLLPAARTPLNWKDTWTAGISGETELSQDWLIRAGYWFVENPVPSRTQLASIPESDQHAVSIGLSHGSNQQGRIDLAYMRVFYADRHIDENLVPAFNGDYEIDAHIFSLSYQKSF